MSYNSPGHHNAIGAVERVSKSLWQKLRNLCEFGNKSWEKILPQAVHAINILYHEGIGTSQYITRHKEMPNFQIDTANRICEKKVEISKL